MSYSLNLHGQGLAAAMLVSPEDAHGSVDEELYLPVTERPFSSPS